MDRNRSRHVAYYTRRFYLRLCYVLVALGDGRGRDVKKSVKNGVGEIERGKGEGEGKGAFRNRTMKTRGPSGSSRREKWVFYEHNGVQDSARTM